MIKPFTRKSPGRMLLLSILGTIVVGSCLLALPYAQKNPLSFMQVFFTATSATCVTGLLTAGLDNFTMFGQFIIFLLMQIGGLGLTTMTFMFFAFFKDMGLSRQWVAGQILDIERLSDVRRMLIFIIAFTGFIELIGALITFIVIRPHYPLPTAIFYACFHAVSSFCSAGLTLFPQGFVQYQTNSTMLITTSFLMFIGGFGFVAWHEILSYIRARLQKKRTALHFSLHTKLIIMYSFLITFISICLFFVLEYNNTLAGLSFGTQLCNAMFNGISIRSTGFLTVSSSALQLATILIIMVISFIGAAPGSTGSGIKTNVFAIFLATCRSVIAGRPAVEIRGRRLAHTQVFKALTIITLSISWIILVTFFLLITEKAFGFLPILFESTSAFVTLGISEGITAHLTVIGQLLIITSMIVGRIGSLTLALAFVRMHDAQEFSYPEERVMLS